MGGGLLARVAGARNGKDPRVHALALVSQALALADNRGHAALAGQTSAEAELYVREGHESLAMRMELDADRKRKASLFRSAAVMGAALGSSVGALNALGLIGEDKVRAACLGWLIATSIGATMAGTGAWKSGQAASRTIPEQRAALAALEARIATVPEGTARDLEFARAFTALERERLDRLNALLRVQLVAQTAGASCDVMGATGALLGLVGVQVPWLSMVALPLGLAAAIGALVGWRLTSGGQQAIEERVQEVFRGLTEAARRPSSEDPLIGPSIIEGYMKFRREDFQQLGPARAAMRIHLGPLTPVTSGEHTVATENAMMSAIPTLAGS